MPKYDYIVFDLDGTIMDSVLDIVNALNATLSAVGVNYVYSRDEGITLLGNGAPELAKKVFQKLNLDDESPLFDEFMDTYYHKYMEYQGKAGKLYDGVLELLKELDKRQIKYGVYSNKPQIIIIDSIEKYMDPKCFTFILGHQEGYPPKPDTRAINEVLEEYHFEKKRMLYVGDSDVDMILAKRIGVDGCGCNYGYRSKEELIDNGATFTINAPLDLLKFL